MTRLRFLFKSTSIYSFTSIISRTLNFFLVPLYTKIFSPNEYGELTILMSLAAILMVILTYGFETSFLYFSSKYENKDDIFSTSFLSLLASSLFFLSFFIFFKKKISFFLLDVNNYNLISILTFIIFFDILSTIPFAKIRLEGKPILFSKIKIFGVSVNIALNLFFFIVCPYLQNKTFFTYNFDNIYIVEFGIGYILISNLLSSFLVFCLLLPNIMKSKLNFDVNIWKQMFKYSFPLLIAGIAFVINEVGDRILLKIILPNEISSFEIGVYSACYKISIFMTIFIQGFKLGFEPYFFTNKNETTKNHLSKIMNYFIAICCFIFLFISVFIDLFKYFIQSKVYYQGLDVIPILLLSNLFLGIYFNLSVWYKTNNKTYYGAYFSLLGALITIILNIILIPHLSYYGSALATLVCYITMSSISYIYCQKINPINYDLKKSFFYIALALFLFLTWKYTHDKKFVMSTIFSVLYILIFLKLENNKSI